jgi:hypothetical protein
VAGRIASAALLVAMAVGLAALGRWGRRHSTDLVSAALLNEDRASKAAVIRRGGLVCYVAAVVMAAVGVLAVL